MIKSCEVCNSFDIKEVLDLGDHALCDDLIKIGDKRRNKKYPIRVFLCKNCFTAHQYCQPSKKELFPEEYHYRARFTLDVINGMKELVNSVENFKGNLNGLKVIDVGCNDGSLLNLFKEKGCKTFGIEPTAAVNDIRDKDHKIMKDFFTIDSSKKLLSNFGKFDLITFTNVFAHINDLDALLKSVENLMHKNTVLIIENHYLGSILEKNQFDTFYHEHPRTYSLKSFINISTKLRRNLSLVSFPKRYGGNIRVFISNKETENKDLKFIKDITKKESKFEKNFNDLSTFINKWKLKKRNEILNLIKENGGPIVGKAFPGRAAILINILELNSNHIRCIFEKPGSKKLGHFVPGSDIPIVSDEILFDNINNHKFILNLAWHIPTEIENYLSSKGFKGLLVDII